MAVMEEKKREMFRDKKILVVGLARSGTGAANLLCSLGAEVTVTDTRSRDSLRDRIGRLPPSVRIMAGGNPLDIPEGTGMVIVSPGVPADIPLLVNARTKGIAIIGELELAYLVVADNLQDPGAARPWIGVTGTNGKSTTTTLVNEMLKESGYKTLLGGNIGNALTEELLKTIRSRDSIQDKGIQLNADYVVAEISSFQLEAIREFRPGIAAILNITPDHLNRYESMDDYINAKARIFVNQGAGDYLILNADDSVIMDLHKSGLRTRDTGLPQVLFFSRRREVEGIYLRDGMICCNFRPNSPGRKVQKTPPDSGLISINEIGIKGVHNLENAMAASLIALTAGCSEQAVKTVLMGFRGLEHRLEYVDEINGVRFINDSKGTNVGAVAKSLEGLDKTILIMGGLDKGGDFSTLRCLIRKKVKLLVLLGKAGEKIAQATGGTTEICKAQSMEEAVNLSYSRASAGDVVLLSPGCASFDMFADFQERGGKFKKAVRGIAK